MVSSNSSSSNWRSCCWLIAFTSCSRSSAIIPVARAIAAAVFTWSPVTMITRIPASLHFLTDSLASGLGGSIIPTIPTNTNPSIALSSIDAAVCFLYARAITRIAWLDHSVIFCSIWSFFASVNAVSPWGVRTLTERSSNSSGAPMTQSSNWPSCFIKVALNLVIELNGKSSDLCWLNCSGSNPPFLPRTDKAPSVGSPTSSCLLCSLLWIISELFEMTAIFKRCNKTLFLSTSIIVLLCLKFPTGNQPSPETEYSSVPETNTFFTVSEFCVSVPVLSVRITDTAPSVSVAVKSRTITFRLDIRRAPIAKTRVMSAGKLSGMAATNAAIDVSRISFSS